MLNVLFSAVCLFVCLSALLCSCLCVSVFVFLCVQYDGYTSCPLLVNRSQVMMAEFGYDGQLLETFPVDQRVPRRIMYLITVNMMPFLYWKLHLRFSAASDAVMLMTHYLKHS